MRKIILRSLTFLFMFMFLLANAYGQNVAGADLERIFDKLSSNKKVTEKIAMDVDVMTYDPDVNGGWQEMPVEKLVRKYRRNGTLLESSAKSYYPDKDGNFQYSNYEFKNIWNGQRSLSRQGSPTYATGFVSNKYDESKAIVHSTKMGNVLDGFFPHNETVGSIIDLFRSQQGNVSLRTSKEMVGQHLCDVIDVDTSSGKYVIWIDPESNYCIRRAKVEIDKNDLAWGKPLHQRSRSCNCSSSERKYYQQMKWVLTDIEIAKIGDVFIPVSGSLIQDSFYKDGSSSKVKFVFKRKNIDLDPDFEALDAFKMDMPEGTIVYDLDFQGVKYQWNEGGEMTAYVEKKENRVVDLIDNAFKDSKFSSEADTSITKVNLELPLNEQVPKKHKQATRILGYLLSMGIGIFIGAVFLCRKPKK